MSQMDATTCEETCLAPNQYQRTDVRSRQRTDDEGVAVDRLALQGLSC